MTQTEENNKLHRRVNTFGKKLTVIKVEGEEYLIGVQIATLLKRETFNMYRSMKIKNIQIKRANPEHVEYLCRFNAVRAGTHSVTLIPYESGLYFIADAWFRQHKSEGFPYSKTSKHPKSFILDQPKLHRRKAHPWNVYRSVKRSDLTVASKQKTTNLIDLEDFSIGVNSFYVPSPSSMDHEKEILESIIFAADTLDALRTSGSPKRIEGLSVRSDVSLCC